MYKKGKKISANEARGGNNQEDNIRKNDMNLVNDMWFIEIKRQHALCNGTTCSLLAEKLHVAFLPCQTTASLKTGTDMLSSNL